MTKPTVPEGVKIGRLALRQEGANWVAYYAQVGTMVDAVFLGSISLQAALKRPERKAAFMDLMREIVADAIEDRVGVRPMWGGAAPAPESERSGNA